MSGWFALIGAWAMVSAAVAQTADFDPLALQVEPPAQPVAESPWRIGLELGVGSIDRRFGLGGQDARRAAIDLRFSQRLTPNWRVSVSDRLDYLDPVTDARGKSRNALREAYFGWRDPGTGTTIEFGRINLRQGPAFGYSPTDFFRVGALQTVTTADPVALRENRLGTVMVRFARQVNDMGFGLALAPEVNHGATSGTWALDLRATNPRDRALLSLDAKLSDRVNVQGLLLAEQGTSARLGANMTALLGDAVVAYADWSMGKTNSLFQEITGVAGATSRRHQAALGLTYSVTSSLAVTMEAEYNGAGLDSDDWKRLSAQGLPAYQRYVGLTQPNQELGAKRAVLLYVSKKGLGLKQLDLTALIRVNDTDHSHLAWLELRHHWPSFDVALQWQRASGSAASEFGASPYKQVVQLLGYWYF